MQWAQKSVRSGKQGNKGNGQTRKFLFNSWKLHRRKVEEKMARNKFLPINLKIKIKTIKFPEI